MKSIKIYISFDQFFNFSRFAGQLIWDQFRQKYNKRLSTVSSLYIHFSSHHRKFLTAFYLYLDQIISELPNRNPNSIDNLIPVKHVFIKGLTLECSFPNMQSLKLNSCNGYLSQLPPSLTHLHISNGGRTHFLHLSFIFCKCCLQ